MQQINSRKAALSQGLTEYCTGKPCKHGHFANRKVSNSECVTCDQLRKVNPGAKLKDRVTLEIHRARSPLLQMFKRKRNRARSEGAEFTILVEDLVFPECCPCCGQRLIPTVTVRQNNFTVSDATPSMDRLDSSLGYVPGNVFIICRRCNTIKNFGTAEEHRRIADWMDEMSEEVAA